MPMKNPSRLHPQPGEEVEVVEVAEEVFNPEAGKASDNPFGEHTAPSQEQAVDSQEAPSEEAAPAEEVSEYDEKGETEENSTD